MFAMCLDYIKRKRCTDVQCTYFLSFFFFVFFLYFLAQIRQCFSTKFPKDFFIFVYKTILGFWWKFSGFSHHRLYVGIYIHICLLSIYIPCLCVRVLQNHILYLTFKKRIYLRSLMNFSYRKFFVFHNFHKFFISPLYT